ncbi:hypothetical protein [Persicobacter psychrovividus]|uniref:Late embryogenesis abundant protein LEA-2 subgroup domain-containing protein n=1 Tax=Persicobacter psychrovividus TaxID=387638 RepID=A0ABN6L876_9BACT|nr:hypothetical protein PEPS_16090 [Persicobacter psychrovividus]
MKNISTLVAALLCILFTNAAYSQCNNSYDDFEDVDIVQTDQISVASMGNVKLTFASYAYPTKGKEVFMYVSVLKENMNDLTLRPYQSPFFAIKTRAGKIKRYEYAGPVTVNPYLMAFKIDKELVDLFKSKMVLKARVHYEGKNRDFDLTGTHGDKLSSGILCFSQSTDDLKPKKKIR